MTEIESELRKLLRPINEQYPRPWMTCSKDPASSKVFLVGANQATPFPVDVVGSLDGYMDALFNRGPEPCPCRRLYERVRAGGPSCTRKNIDDLVIRLERHLVTDVLETNVVCYSTEMSEDLKEPKHAEGDKVGREIFRALFTLIKPRVLIAHGKGTVEKLEKVLEHKLPAPPDGRSPPVEEKVGQTSVFVIKSLSPPEFNKWASWRDEHLDELCRDVAKHLGQESK